MRDENHEDSPHMVALVVLEMQSRGRGDGNHERELLLVAVSGFQDRIVFLRDTGRRH